MFKIKKIDYLKSVLCFKIILCFLYLCAYNHKLFADNDLIESSSWKAIGDIKVLSLHGSYEDMGLDYGVFMKDYIHSSLNILLQHYKEQGLTREEIRQQADFFFNRFPRKYQSFIYAVSIGAKISFEDAKMLNAMEAIHKSKEFNMFGNTNQMIGNCAFVYLSTQKTVDKSSIIGRNYDYPKPFDQISRMLTVTVLNPSGLIPTAIIAMPGQIYCPTCINSHGLFIELNNGTPSGGNTVLNNTSLLTQMLDGLFKSKNTSELSSFLNTQSGFDYSLILNFADKNSFGSYEYSTSQNAKKLFPSVSLDYFVSTNFFLNTAWQGIPTPTDDTTWLGVTRRNNLLQQIKAGDKTVVDNFGNTNDNHINQDISNNIYTDQFDINRFKSIMDLDINHGGGKWDFTIYQIIFNTYDQSLYIKLNSKNDNWNHIKFHDLFR